MLEQLDILMGKNEPQFLPHITHKNKMDKMDHQPKKEKGKQEHVHGCGVAKIF